ncbi:MAG: glycosyl transferase [Saccharofermentans sp.]|nr:glycosyl transferase [Saccharofermentans sp.]
MGFRGELARAELCTASDLLAKKFGDKVTGGKSAQYVRFGKDPVVIGVSGLEFDSVIVSVIAGDDACYEFIKSVVAGGASILLAYDGGSVTGYCEKGGEANSLDIPSEVASCVISHIKDSSKWGGVLKENGELEFDPASPAPGPHYYTNMLIGNRIKFDHPLQSTPKSTVGSLGGGSFRSHADCQVLATRWDYLPEENGFPANRQFYLVSGGKTIFWSGAASAEGLKSVKTVHSQNRTVISYELTCGLKIKRTIFIVPQHEDMPLASEAQMIDIENTSSSDMDLRIVYTGMFGTNETHALSEDVIFTTVVAQSEVFFNEDNEIRALSFNPNPKWTKGNVRFSETVVHTDSGVIFPDQYCVRYGDFVGSGSIECPEFIDPLACRPSRKGPGFFAMSIPFTVKAGAAVRADNITCLSSDAVNKEFLADVTPGVEAEAVAAYISDKKNLEADLKSVIEFTGKYAGYMQISHSDKDFEAYVNNNLPFQVFYQTFVSRSLDWTQKGYREIGFREIQDIFASMYYFAGMGETGFVKKMLAGWIENVYEDGYTNHNFYWIGKEPGWWSDDGLWLLQALDRYLGLTGDYDFLSEEFVMAGTKEKLTDPGVKRKLSDTLKAILTYSGKISIGKHGIPLIDRADWNDCLRVDPDCISGKEKIADYKKQLEASGKAYAEVPYESEYSESVMNGFLLKVAIDAGKSMFEKIGDAEFASELGQMSSSIAETLKSNCWKDDFYARVLFNRSNKPELKYLGAAGDGLALEEGHPGSYFLNAFSWSLLAGVATEDQITTMLDSLDKYLKSPYGFRLCSTVDYSKIAPKIDVALYYPGDRENGGVFKHANMMACSAMLKAANTVEDKALAERLTETAYWIIDKILPFKTMGTPFFSCGNPRWCTQYNNSESGENIGPTLSGTSTWLLLSLFQCFGVEFTSEGLICEPLLRKSETSLEVKVSGAKAKYDIKITKPEGFVRSREGVKLVVDGKAQDDTKVPVFTDGMSHSVEINF